MKSLTPYVKIFSDLPEEELKQLCDGKDLYYYEYDIEEENPERGAIQDVVSSIYFAIPNIMDQLALTIATIANATTIAQYVEKKLNDRIEERFKGKIYNKKSFVLRINISFPWLQTELKFSNEKEYKK